MQSVNNVKPIKNNYSECGKYDKQSVKINGSRVICIELICQQKITIKQMGDELIIQQIKRNKFSLSKFNHFDYVESVEAIDQQIKLTNPKKYKIISQFAKKCRYKLDSTHQTSHQNQQPFHNFIKRAQMYQKLHEEKIQALRFLNQHYDLKNDQLLFYPKTKNKLKNKYHLWANREDTIQPQQNIPPTNKSQFYKY